MTLRAKIAWKRCRQLEASSLREISLDLHPVLELFVGKQRDRVAFLKAFHLRASGVVNSYGDLSPDQVISLQQVHAGLSQLPSQRFLGDRERGGHCFRFDLRVDV